MKKMLRIRKTFFWSYRQESILAQNETLVHSPELPIATMASALQ